MDMSAVINWERIKLFRPLTGLDETFLAAKPRLFGALLDLPAMTLSNLTDTKPTGVFRMANFAPFGCAIAGVLGQKSEDFDYACRSNIPQ